MKKFLTLLCVLALVFTSTGIVFAAGEGHNVNQSAEFIRILNRNASTDADAAFYNPAGTATMKDGLWLYVSSQTIFQTRTVEDPTNSLLATKLKDEYQGDTFVPVFPNFYAVYKQGDIAAFFGFAPVGGGGTAKFDDGLPAFYWLSASKVGSELVTGVPATTATGLVSLKQEFEGSSTYLLAQAGASYKINDMIAAALGLKYVYGMEAYKGKVTPTYSTVGAGNQSATQQVDTELTGQSFGVVAGVNVKPMDGLNVGIRYEWYSKLELEADTSKDDVGLYPDGAKFKKTLPQIAALGVSYMILPVLKAEASFTYAFNKQTAWNGAQKDFDNAYDIGIGFEYTILQGLKASIGYLYGKSGANVDTNSEMSYGLDSHTFGAGATYTIIPDLDLTLGYCYTMYEDAKVPSVSGMGKDVTLGKVTHDIAIGVTYKAL